MILLLSLLSTVDALGSLHLRRVSDKPVLIKPTVTRPIRPTKALWNRDFDTATYTATPTAVAKQVSDCVNVYVLNGMLYADCGYNKKKSLTCRSTTMDLNVCLLFDNNEGIYAK